MPQNSELGIGKHRCDPTLDTTSFVVVVSPSLKHDLNTSDDNKIPISPNLIPLRTSNQVFLSSLFVIVFSNIVKKKLSHEKDFCETMVM